LSFEGQGEAEIGRVTSVTQRVFNAIVGSDDLDHAKSPLGSVVVLIDRRYSRLTNVEALLGNSQKAFNVFPKCR
jgi:GDP-D-mannose dehydratase